MMHKVKVLIIISLLLCLAETRAFAGGTVELSLSDCVDIGLANNLDIKIAKIESMIAGQGVMLAESVFDTLLAGSASYADNQLARANTFTGTKSLQSEYVAGLTKTLPTGTELSIDYSDVRDWSDSVFSVNNPTHTAELSFSGRQPILKNFFGLIDRSKVKIAQIDFEIADIKALDRIENSIADIEKGYWNLVHDYQDVALRKRLLEEATELYKTYEDHLKSGIVEETDLYESEANMRTREAQLEIAENSLITASNHLRFLLNEDGNFLIKPKEKLEIFGGRANLVESLNQAFAANRNYRMKKKELVARKVKVKMERNSLWPEVDLVGTLAVNGVDRKHGHANALLSTNKFSEYYGGIEVSYPLENRAARSKFNTASLEKEKIIVELLKMEKTIFTRIDEAVRDVNIRLETAKQWANITEIQYKKLKEEEKKLRYGRSTTKIVVDYQRDYMLAAIRNYLTILEYYHSLIDLENAKDKLLERVGVTKI